VREEHDPFVFTVNLGSVRTYEMKNERDVNLRGAFHLLPVSVKV
jgi:hypothetical protein